jgi:hypothetical protein
MNETKKETRTIIKKKEHKLKDRFLCVNPCTSNGLRPIDIIHWTNRLIDIDDETKGTYIDYIKYLVKMIEITAVHNNYHINREKLTGELVSYLYFNSK